MAFAFSASAPRAFAGPQVAQFVSVGFTLRVWRRWLRDKALSLRNIPPFRVRYKPNRRTIWIFGGARSGTTWLLESISRGYNLHAVHEFFNVANPLIAEDSYYRTPAIVTEPDEVAEQLLHRALAQGECYTAFDKHNPLIQLRRRDGRVLKDIGFSNTQISALTRNRPEIEVVFIIRQPIEVMRSMISAKDVWNWEGALGIARVSGFLEANRHKLDTEAVNRIERMLDSLTAGPAVAVAVWCLENLVALETQSGKPNFKVAYYHRLTESEQAAKQHIEELLGPMKRDPRLAKRSITDYRKHAELTPDDLAAAASVFEILGLQPFQLADQPHLLDLEKLVADFQKPSSARLNPRFLKTGA